MKTVNQRVKEVMQEKGLSQTFVAKKVGLTQPTLSAFVNGTGSTTVLPQIANVLGVSIDYLLTGKVDHGQNLPNPAQDKTSLEHLSKIKMLPVLSWVQAGSLTSSNPIEAHDIKEWYPALSSNDCEQCFYLRVRGISNFPEFQEGDFIQVDPTIYPDELVSGDIIVIHNYEGETFKKLIIENNGRKYLQALNPDWKPNIIEFDEDTRLIGIVVDGFRPIGGSRKHRVRKA